MNYRSKIVVCLALYTSIASSSALAQSTGYFSEFDDGSVIKNVGGAVVENDCELDLDAFVDIVEQQMVAAEFETEMSAKDFAQVMLGNLRSRKQVELAGETLTFSGIAECEGS